MRSLRTAAYAITVLSVAATPVASAATPTTPGSIASNLTNVNILTFNDFHGHIDDNGLALACLIEQRRSALGPNQTVLVSNGDNIGASPFVSASAGDLPTMKYLNAIGVTASSVGNHEFDKGYNDIIGRVAQNEAFPTLGANVYKKGTTTPALPEYHIQTVNGVRIAMIGAVTGDTPNIVMPDGIKDVDFGDPVAAVNRVSAQIKAAGTADVIIAAYHSGATVSNPPADLATAQTSLPEFNDIATKTSSSVDVILNAHTHQTYVYDAPTADGTRPLIQSSSYGKMLGEVQLGIDPTTKKIVSYAQQNLTTKNLDQTPCANDPVYLEAKSIIDAAKAQAAATGNIVVGTQTDDIMRGPGESPLGNLDAQAWLDQMNAPGRPGADIGIMNPGGVRSDLPFASNGVDKDGEITFAEAFAVNPFGNTMQIITLTGTQLRTLLEQQWTTKTGEAIVPLLGLSNNVRYTYDPTKPFGERIVSVTVNGKEIAATDTFRVTSGSFIIGGGDGYTVLKEGTNKIDTGLNDGDEFVSWIKSHSPITPDLSKRGMLASEAPAPSPSPSASPSTTTSPSASPSATPSATSTTSPSASTTPSASPSASVSASDSAAASTSADTAAPSATTSTTATGPRVETDGILTGNSQATAVIAGLGALVLAASALLRRRMSR